MHYNDNILRERPVYEIVNRGGKKRSWLEQSSVSDLVSSLKTFERKLSDNLKHFVLKYQPCRLVSSIVNVIALYFKLLFTYNIIIRKYNTRYVRRIESNKS